jgi:DNA-directed RNA polymerase omega subunit
MNDNEDKDQGHYTSQDAARQVGSIYDLVLIATARARELKRHHPEKLSKNWISTALREVEDGKIGKEYLQKHVKDSTRKHKNKWKEIG